MRTRSLAMNNTGMPSFFRRIFFLLLKGGLVVFLTMAAGWGYGYALLKAGIFSGNLLKAAVVLMSAAVAGILSRFVLHGEGRVAIFSAALAAVAASLLDLASLSGSRLGFPLPGASEPLVEWAGAWQLAIGAAVVLLAISAWHKPAPRAFPVKPPLARKSRKAAARTSSWSKLERKLSRFWKSISLKKWMKRLCSYFKSRWKKAAAAFAGLKTISYSTARRISGAVPRKRPAAPAHLPVVKFHRAAEAAPGAAAFPLAPAARRMPKSPRLPIRLVGREEHRCPYCLGVVSPGDPAGIVICPVCKTYHHKSCWDVTGECQVPHLHP